MKHFPLAQPIVRPELGYFGEVTDMAAQTLPKLPSSASVQAAINGERHGWSKVLASTALRAILIAPGVALAGARGRELVLGSVLSSATITAFIFFFYGTNGSGSNGG